MRLLGIAVPITALVLASPAWCQGLTFPATPEQRAATSSHNREVIASTPVAEGVFVVGDDGSIKHLQSGLICPAKFPSVTLFHVLVYQSAEKGGDVGCDYRRADEQGGAYAKLTIFVTKAVPEATVDSAFAGYQREIAQVWKDVRPLGPAIKMVDKGGGVPDFRSEEYLVTLNERDNTSDLVVAITAGWVVEIRATFVGGPNEIQVPKGASIQEATIALGDRAMASQAFIAALGTVGK